MAFLGGRLEESHRALSRALELAPAMPWAQALMARVEGRQGQQERALERIERALKGGEEEVLLLARADVRHLFGDREGALRDLEAMEDHLPFLPGPDREAWEELRRAVEEGDEG